MWMTEKKWCTYLNKIKEIKVTVRRTATLQITG